MRQSLLFTKTSKTAPKDEVSKNASLLIRAGFVHKEMAGVYSYLPLGLRVITKLETLVRKHMDAIGGQEIRMATLHPSEPWKQTGAWDTVDVLFKILSQTGKEYAMGQSEEEIVTPIVAKYALSYRDFPVAVYQIGQKYRDELRAKSGIMRGREFGMKDMYSFHPTQEDFDRFYAIVKAAYLDIYETVGLKAKATEASGGSFSEKISYEFMVLTDAGEDFIFYCDHCDFCINEEVAESIKEGDVCQQCGKENLKKGVASEVGNVFDLGTRYPKAFQFTFKDQSGEEHYPIVGCYGLGITRLMGVIVEALADEKGMVWPVSVAPYQVHLIGLGNFTEAEKIYTHLQEQGIEVLYDDREARAGEKFADADLIGIPHRVVVGKSYEESGKLEYKARTEESPQELGLEELVALLQASL